MKYFQHEVWKFRVLSLFLPKLCKYMKLIWIIVRKMKCEIFVCRLDMVSGWVSLSRFDFEVNAEQITHKAPFQTAIWHLNSLLSHCISPGSIQWLVFVSLFHTIILCVPIPQKYAKISITLNSGAAVIHSVAHFLD